MHLHEVWTRAEQDTVTAALARSSAQFGARIFLDFTGESYSYADIDRESTRLARSLQQLGVKKGDTVASVLDNNVHAVLAWFAINKAGAVSVPVNTAYKGEFLRHQLNDCGAKLVIAESDYAQRVVDVAEDLASVRTLVQRDGKLVSGLAEVLPLASLLENSTEPLADVNAPADLAMLI
jgi:crotonobetaine/carnitine-CoA ligase